VNRFSQQAHKCRLVFEGSKGRVVSDRFSRSWTQWIVATPPSAIPTPALIFVKA